MSEFRNYSKKELDAFAKELMNVKQENVSVAIGIPQWLELKAAEDKGLIRIKRNPINYYAVRITENVSGKARKEKENI